MPGPVRSWVARHRIVAFLLVAYGFTWAVQAAVLALDLQASWTQSILIGFGGFGPPVAAGVVVWAAGGDLRAWVGQLFRWNVGWRWWAVALLLPLAILAAGSAVFAAVGGPLDLSVLPWPGIYVFVLVYAAILGGGQEELGWRGFLLPMLQGRYSALRATILVGLAWTAWHLPLLLNSATTHGGWPLGQQLLWGVTIFSGAILWTWMYNVTGGSVLLVALFHGGINAMGVLHPADPAELYPGGVPDPWLTALAEASSAVVMVALVLAIVWYYGPAHLAPEPGPTGEDLGLD